MKDVRFVGLHRPGPRWQAGVPLFEQEGLGEHVAHCRQWLAQGSMGFQAGLHERAAHQRCSPAPIIPQRRVAAHS